MKKVFLVLSTLLLLLCLGYASFGKKIDESTAKTIGSNFLISKGINGVQSPSDLTRVYAATSTVTGNLITDYYVFNINNHNGFIMVSGDDLIEPILAYSNEASFNFDAISPEAKLWIEGYQNQIAYVIGHNLPAQAGVADQWNELKTPFNNIGARTTTVSPLLATTWDQAPYYNIFCPGTGSNKSVTGCVATAMAQVMKFWNWPTVGTGAHSYTTSTMSYSMSADFGNTVYNWAGMPNSLTSNNAAVGTLMLHAGISVNMNYTSTESGAFVISLESPYSANCAEFALKTYFHYKPTLQGIPRFGEPSGTPGPIAQATWISMIEAELNAGRPVIYSGSSTTAGGHCWVCDGYNSSNQMHFNWGWSGTGPDGYYSVNAIAPPVLGIGGGGGNFNNDQCIIIGIQPDSFPASSTGNLKMLAHLDCPTNSQMTYNSSFTVTAKVLNTGSTTYSGDFCVQLFDKNNNMMGTVQTITGQTITAGDSTASLTFSSTGMLQMIPGLYGLMLMYRPSGSTTWTAVANNGTFINYNSIDVGNSQVVELADSLHLGSHTIVRGSAMTVTTKLINLDAIYVFSGTVEAVLINTTTATAYPVQLYTGTAIYSNSVQSYTFTSSGITVPAGQYVLTIRHQPGGTGSYIVTGSDYYENPVVVNIVSAVGINTVSPDNNITIYPNPANDVVNIDLNGANVSEIRISDVEGRLVKQLRRLLVSPSSIFRSIILHRACILYSCKQVMG